MSQYAYVYSDNGMDRLPIRSFSYSNISEHDYVKWDIDLTVSGPLDKCNDGKIRQIIIPTNQHSSINYLNDKFNVFDGIVNVDMYLDYETDMGFTMTPNGWVNLTTGPEIRFSIACVSIIQITYADMIKRWALAPQHYPFIHSIDAAKFCVVNDIDF